LNAEGAKDSQSTQKRKYQKNTKKIKDIFINKSLTKKNLAVLFSLSSSALFANPSRPLRSKNPRLYPHIKKLNAQAMPA
jgi:hypothetical protein